MNLLQNIPLSPAQLEKIENSVVNYKRMAKVYISILEVKNQAITVRIEQKELVNSKLLTQKELIDRAKAVFADIPEGWKVNVRALTYKGDLHTDLSLEDILAEMEKRNLKQRDLSKYLGIDKHMLSKLLNGHTAGLTGWQKAAFYYLFKWMDAAGQ